MKNSIIFFNFELKLEDSKSDFVNGIISKFLLLVLRALNKCPPKNPVYPEINILKFQYPF